MSNNLRRLLATHLQNISTGGGISLPSLLRNALFALFIAGIFAYGAAFAVYMLIRFDLFNLLRDVNGDDSFYYFQIAYNLAEGKFSTFDGGITRTNGYHPLWMLMITPFYWVFDKESALFGIKVFELMLVAGGVALIAVAARLTRLSWILLFAVPPLLYHQDDPQGNTFTSGLEPAAALFMLGLFILALCLFARNAGRWKWLLVGVAFLLPWVRLEYIAISLAGTGALCLLEWSWRDRRLGAWWRTSASRREFVRSITALKALPSLIAATAGILVYFAYNGIVFGGIIPVSAATKRLWSQVRWEQSGGYNLLESLSDTMRRPVFDYELLVAAEVCVYLLLVWWFARRSRSRRDWLVLAFLVGVFSLSAGHLAKFAQTTVLFGHPDDPVFTWYFVPAYLMMALIIPIRCYVAIYFVRYFSGHRHRPESIILSACIVAAGAIFLLWNTDFTRPFKFIDQVSRSTHQEFEIAQYAGVQITNNALPEGSIFGTWDSGVTGYFSRFPVVNLDGLVNSYDYFHLKGSQLSYRKNEYAPIYREFGITHFTNVTSGTYDKYVLYQSSLIPPDKRFTIWLWEPLEKSDAFAQFWESIEPHFDYNSDGTAMVVDGRLVQMFADDCAPHELAVLTLSGHTANGQADEMTAEAWTQTQTGLCVATILLPHDTQTPTQVERMSAEDYLAQLAENYLARLVGDSEPVISSGYDVYLVDGDLIYAKRECDAADTDAAFFLHIIPVDADDLPNHRKQHGFDNLDFAFMESDTSIISRDMCVVSRALPDYGIDEIKTGQYVRVDGGYEHLWEGTISPR